MDHSKNNSDNPNHSNNSQLFIKDSEPTFGSDLSGEPITSHTKKRTIDAAIDIQQNELGCNVDFLHTVMCQVGMPRRPTSEREFLRKNGQVSMLMEAGSLYQHKQWVAKPLPSGAKPRLIMIHICSEAVRTGNPRIEVGFSVRQFLKTLQLNPDGREYRRFKNQMEALAACHILLGFSNGQRSTTLDVKPINEFTAWCSDDDDQRTLWPGIIQLSQPFFDTIRASAVPLDRRALRGIQHSALCLDIYTWLAHRLHRIPKKNGVDLSWDNLHRQFGEEYAQKRGFKRKFIQALKQTLAVYPNAKVEDTANGLLFKNSPPPVPKTLFLVSTSNLS